MTKTTDTVLPTFKSVGIEAMSAASGHELRAALIVNPDWRHAMDADRAAYVRKKLIGLDEATPDWRNLRHVNGTFVFSLDGTMLDDKGNRSIFDDVDE